MTMPPLEENPELSRPYFAGLRLLSEKLMQEGLFPAIEKPELSMGMSSDFHIAIEEGATIVRVGTAIFGRAMTAQIRMAKKMGPVKIQAPFFMIRLTTTFFLKPVLQLSKDLF